MSVSSLFRVLGLLGLLTIFCSACTKVNVVQGYPGEELNSSEVAKIVLPPEIDVRSVDSKRLKTFHIIRRRDMELHLLPGTRVVELRYNRIWDVDAEDFDRTISEPYPVTFDAEEGGVYYVEYNKPENYKEAAAFVESPEFGVITSKPNYGK